MRRSTERVGGERVGLIAYSDSSKIGGAEASLRDRIAALDARFDVSVVGVDRETVESIAAPRPSARTVTVRPVRNKRDVGPILEHMRVIRSMRPDVFHANLRHPWSCQYGLLAALRTPGAAIVAVEHLAVPSSSRLQRLLCRRIFERVDAHVAVGERSARAVEEFIGLQVGSVETIYNGVPDIELDVLPRPGDGPVIGALGRLDEQKGFDVLVRALVDLPGVTAVVVGEGPERARLDALAGELGVADRFEIVDWPSQPRDWLTTFDVFVLPSRFEILPLAIVQAMLAGLPIVTTRVGSVDEAVRDGETGVFIAPEQPRALAEVVRGLLSDPSRRKKMGEAGRRFALERFSMETTTAEFEALYDEILR
ncbi:MAG: glycosyltransferase family 4 protein [Acidimicrobiia bacterium]|nr:glycosyltransferase family 4 protein [Acidimicrobiia bacterium]